MKRILISALVVAFAAFGFSTFAFHSGGVAECEGCHSMHDPASPSHLLVNSDASSSCLSCHDGPTLSSYHVSSTGAVGTGTGLPTNRTPGGDFSWLKKTYTFGTTTYSEGRTHGHNIIATDFGYVAEDGSVDPNGPGGDFPKSQLGCNSCHDPHGKARRLSDGSYAATGAPIISSGSYSNNADPAAGQAVGVYRLLYANVSPDKPSNTNYTGVAVAVAPQTYNRSEPSAASQTRVAYGGGGMTNSWGNWCGSCHNEFNSTSKTEHHPIEVALSGGGIDTKYGQYVSSGIMTGTSATSYSTLVPFAESTENYATLRSHATTAFRAGPASTDTVTCLSCHRAHASGFGHALRFYYTYEFMTKGGEYVGMDNPLVGTTGRGPIQAGGRNIADFQAAYYDRPAATNFGPYDRVLCNKCHAQD